MAYKAFVSSTFEDLEDHRAHVIRSLRRAGFFVDPMEEWPADSGEPKNFPRIGLVVAICACSLSRSVEALFRREKLEVSHRWNTMRL